ncbi:hypothetical protein UFOVP16_45 [uncultured Caudovirales phage]|uniref:DdrB-like domain-containing protein n=1 Tax=uncultured Caudovirales phage TaxID=2100421 RepID=A0A6J5KIV2_9CAUD|nr:hypothetical protein UFOVP16_45 [uncultured Caudovirales phage]
MSFFDLDPVATQNVIDQARMNPIKPEDLQPSWYAGAYKPIVTGPLSALANANQLLDDAVYPPLVPAAKSIDKIFGTSIAPAIEAVPAANQNFKDLVTPDPRTTGVVGQVAHSMVRVIGETALGGPEVAATLEGYSGYKDAQNQGVDTGTALGLGALNALSTWAGLKVPMSFGPKFSLLATVTGGAGINAGLGLANRATTGAFLEARGYHDMAAQYKVLDSSAIATDLIMGAAFGAFGHYEPAIAAKVEAWRTGSKGKLTPTDIDTALALNNQRHIETGTPPGIPADPATRQAHVENINSALESLIRGEPVEAKGDIANRNFIEDPAATAMRSDIVRVVGDHIGPEWVALEAELKARGLSTDDIDTSAPYKVETAVSRMPSEVPHAIMGSEAAVKISGVYHPVRWALVDAANVEATMAKADNQFRDRGRAASQTQVAKIASEPDFNLLGNSPIMDFGAPTLTRDGRIIGGNGRFAGVSEAYNRGTGEQYSKPLKENLHQYGIDPAAAEGMKKPVLVRILQSDVDVQKAAMASNEGAGLRMSALEQAKVDGIRLGDMSGIKISESGDLNNASNRKPITQWVGQFPETEAAGLLGKNGILSAEGSTRLRNAILFRAYGDSPTLERLVESTDVGSRNIATALLRTAAKVAEAKNAIENGNMQPLDISDDIAGAIEKLNQLREDGEKVQDYLNQGSLLGSDLSSVSRKLLQFFDENIRSAKSMAELINHYYDNLSKAGDPNHPALFETEQPTKDQLLDLSLKQTDKEIMPGLFDMPFADEAAAAADPAARHLAQDGVLNDEEIGKLRPDQRGVLRDLYDKAAKAKDGFDQAARDVADAVGGGLMTAPLKGSRRAVGKIEADYEGDASRIKDLLRATIEVDSPEQARTAVEMLRQKFNVIKSGFRDLLDPAATPVDGYRDAKMNVQIGGVVAELQVNLREMLAAKKEAHALYEERSKIERESKDRERTWGEQARIEQLNSDMRAIYDAAFASSNSAKKLALDTGAPLRRAETGSNTRGGSLSQAAQDGTPLPAEMVTGMPSTSKNSQRAENSGDFIGNTSNPDISTGRGGVNSGEAAIDPEVKQILGERPYMTIPNGDGQPTHAMRAIAEADAEIETAKQDAQGFDAAVACALRG